MSSCDFTVASVCHWYTAVIYIAPGKKHLSMLALCSTSLRRSGTKQNALAATLLVPSASADHDITTSGNAAGVCAVKNMDHKQIEARVDKLRAKNRTNQLRLRQRAQVR